MTQNLTREGRRMTLRVLAFLVATSTSCVWGAGFAHNTNFTVFTQAMLSVEASQAFAESVRSKAEQYRREIAGEWFGEELPPGVGRTTINVTFAAFDDAGLTWVIDHPERKLHTIYLSTSPEESLGGTLAHEIAHVVLATRYPHPHRLPAWLEEGIACRYDGPERKRIRSELIRWFDRTGNWPRLDGVLSAEHILAEEKPAYAAAASLIELLLARGDRTKLLAFGQDASRVGWTKALAQHYGIRDGDELQRRWQDWAKSREGADGRMGLTRLVSPALSHGQ
jgi:hypothetical protein